MPAVCWEKTRIWNWSFSIQGSERNTVKWSEKTAWYTGILLTLLLSVGKAEPADLIVSAAMSLKAPFNEIGKIFEAEHQGSRVYFNFGASGVLEKQIEGGAPVDLFASASPREMEALEKKDLIIKGSRKDFAGNSIVLIIPVSSSTSLRELKDLEKKEVKRIAVGNPSTVPAGEYAEEVLQSAGLWKTVQKKMIFAENVRQIMDYVARQETDAGMVFLSDALLAKKEVKIVWEAPDESHRPIRYVLAPVKGTAKGQLVRDFMETVFSAKGGNVLEKYGFRKVKGN
jgi:molybdate transport system substrate-binding protein